MNSDAQWYTAQQGAPGFESIGWLTPFVLSCMFCVGLLLPQCKDMHAQLIDCKCEYEHELLSFCLC